MKDTELIIIFIETITKNQKVGWRSAWLSASDGRPIYGSLASSKVWAATGTQGNKHMFLCGLVMGGTADRCLPAPGEVPTCLLILTACCLQASLNTHIDYNRLRD